MIYVGFEGIKTHYFLSHLVFHSILSHLYTEDFFFKNLLEIYMTQISSGYV